MDYIYDISIIIVNYNGKKYLFNLFESLKKIEHDGFTFEVVFVDNNSLDNSIEYIQEHGWQNDMNIQIVANTDNQGFAQGNNSGVSVAKGKYIVFLNNDTAVDKQWLKNLYDFINSNQEYGMVASKLLFFYDFIAVSFCTKDTLILEKQTLINGNEYVIENKFTKNVLFSDQITCFGNTEIALPLIEGSSDYIYRFKFAKYNEETDYMTLGNQKININNPIIEIHVCKDEIEQYRYSIIQNAGSDINRNYDGFDMGMGETDSERFSTIKEINSGCGAAIIMLKEDFLKIGQFDEKFFMYYEDVDLSFRLKKLKKKIMYCPYAIVRHVHTGSSKEWSPFFAYHVYRNKLLFIYKDISKITFLKFAMRQLLKGIIDKDQVKLFATLDALKIALLRIDVTKRTF